MEPFLSNELIQSLGIIGIPILTVTAVIYYLFKLLNERDKIMREMVDNFNKTIQQHLSSNTVALDMMMKNFEDWRNISTKEHERILDQSALILSKIK